MIKELGRGSYGVVYLVKALNSKENKNLVVMKKISFD